MKLTSQNLIKLASFRRPKNRMHAACPPSSCGYSWSLPRSMPWRVLGTQSRGVLRLAQFSRPSLCMPVDLIVFLILAYDLISFLSQAGMCQRCAKVLIHSLIHLFTQTEDPTRQVIQVSCAIGHGTIQRRQPMDWILPASWDLQSSSLR